VVTRRETKGETMRRVITGVTALGVLFCLALPGLGLATGSGEVQVDLTGQMRTNPCNNEIVTLQGRVHFAFNAGPTHVTEHTNWQDVSGVGSFGNLYRASEETRTYIAERPGDKFVIVIEDGRVLASSGSAPNFVQHARFEITFPGGTVETHLSEHCSGTA
jgi:hypothetical protein